MDISDVMMECSRHGIQVGLIKAIYEVLRELSIVAKRDKTYSDLEFQKVYTAVFNLECQLKEKMTKRQLQMEMEVE